MEIRLSKALPSELKDLLPLMEEFYRLEAIRFHPESLVPALQKLLEQDQWGAVFWIQEGAKRLGYVVLTYSYSLEYGGHNALIDELFLTAEFRGKGLGRKVLSLLELECERLTIGVLYLEASRKNEPAQRLYRKQGYVDQDRFLLVKRIDKKITF